MNEFTLYESDTDEMDIIMMEHTIEVERAINDFYKNSIVLLLESANTGVEPKVPEKGGSRFMNTIRRIIESIKRVIDSLVTAFKSTFSGTENMTPEEYFGSNTGQIQLSGDMAKVEAEVDKEILKGRKLIQALSSATGVSDTTIASFVDSAGSIMKRVAPVAITATAAWGIQSFAFKSLNKKQKELDELKAEAEKIADTDEKKDKCVKIFNGIEKAFTTYLGVQKEFNKEMRRAKRKGK